MGALRAAIVGGPLTVTFLVLESTGNLGIAGGVLAASIATTLAVRATFGYSFTTWRLHLRGETILGAQDVGWRREFTVGGMMSPRRRLSGHDDACPPFARLSARQRQCRGRGRRRRPLSRPRVGAGGARGRRRGRDEAPIGLVARYGDDAPSRRRHPRGARRLRRATPTRSPSPSGDGHVLGTLGEAFAARRYAQETDGAMKGVLGGG